MLWLEAGEGQRTQLVYHAGPYCHAVTHTTEVPGGGILTSPVREFSMSMVEAVVLSAGETAAKEVRNALLARFLPAPLLKVRRFLYDLKYKGKAEFLT